MTTWDHITDDELRHELDDAVALKHGCSTKRLGKLRKERGITKVYAWQVTIPVEELHMPVLYLMDKYRCSESTVYDHRKKANFQAGIPLPEPRTPTSYDHHPAGERAIFGLMLHLLDVADDKGREIGEPVNVDCFLDKASGIICDLMRMPGRVVGGRMEWEVQAP
jgi:hypothetical protein